MSDLPDDFCPGRDDDWADPIQAYMDLRGEMPDLPSGVYRIGRTLRLVGPGGASSTHIAGATGGAYCHMTGGGGNGGRTRYEPLWMPDCPACGQPIPATGEPCLCMDES
jgi:hypothetical protein